MFVKSEILRAPHAFSTRLGGVSTLSSTESLNLAFGRGDKDDTVFENLNIFGREAGFDPRNVISLPQVHSSVVHKVDRKHAGLGYFKRDYENYDICEGDGYVTDDPLVVLGVKSADCVPILMEARDRDGRIIAVGAVHAGWKGTAGAIAAVCVEKLRGEYGASECDIYAAVGPCIHNCCYEVGRDVFDEVVARLGDKYAEFFGNSRESEAGEEKYMCDLPGINCRILTDAGLQAENIEALRHCTCCEHDLFYSHRYTKGQRGTMLSVIRMP